MDNDLTMPSIAQILGYTEVQLRAKDKQLQRTYGIGITDFFLVLREQNMCCPVCGKEYSRKARFCVDHEHTEGLVGHLRGILCFTCNIKYVGHLRADMARRIVNYLEDPPARRILGDHKVTGVKSRARRKKRRRPTNAKRQR